MGNDTMTSRRWNQFIRAINDNNPKSSVNIQNEEEDKIFDDMVNELAELRKTDPKAAFWPVETEW